MLKIKKLAKDDSLNNNNGLVDYFEDLKIPQNKRYRVKGRLLAILKQEERSGMCNILFSVVFILFAFFFLDVLGFVLPSPYMLVILDVVNGMFIIFWNILFVVFYCQISKRRLM